LKQSAELGGRDVCAKDWENCDDGELLFRTYDLLLGRFAMLALAQSFVAHDDACQRGSFAASRTSDVIEASVVVCAKSRRQSVLTADIEDLSRLDSVDPRLNASCCQR
jgi:hypothetical protein